ncbi:MAG: DsbA family protein [Proteobacteria bacterium]|nr:DsbA family protein [Pseudomonadota bacterium]MDA0928638.1 DsbA family protein [Pseudomonadota bacterium]
MPTADKKISLTCFSDVLCIWAYIAQARVDEVERQYGSQVEVDYRFCAVFADTRHKMATTWADRGGYEGFADHLQEVGKQFQHIHLHPDIWRACRPLSSTPAHQTLKAAQQNNPDKFGAFLHRVREGFFERALDIANADILEQLLEETGIPVEPIQQMFRQGEPQALLEGDMREKEHLLITGSPTFVLNEGRQKLYGNVGYGVIEANIKELLKSPNAGAASWC